MVAAALHQPSPEVVALLDQLCVLAGGRVVYLGPPGGLEGALAAAWLACPAHRAATWLQLCAPGRWASGCGIWFRVQGLGTIARGSAR